MADSPDRPDPDQITLELVQLRRRHAELQRRVHQLRERNAAFPNGVTLTRQSRLAAELTEVAEQIARREAPPPRRRS